RLEDITGQAEVALRPFRFARCSRDMGADGGTHGEIERHQSQAAAFAGYVEIAVEHQIGEFAVSLVDQVHQQKGQIVEHVDRGYRVVEFNRVEQRRLAVEEADIAQMQI